jgi:integrase
VPRPEAYETRNIGTRWRVRYRHDGKHSSKTFATPPEAQHFCNLIRDYGLEFALAEINREDAEANEMTLDGWAARHFDSLTNVTPGTLISYRRIYARTWQPLLGHYRLSQLNRELIAKAVQQIPGSDKTVKNAWGVLATMLKVAVADGHLPKSPAAGIKLAKRTSHEKTEHRYLTEAEFWQVLDDTPEHWRPLIAMLGGTGMRWGEAAALLVGDVDLERATVRITKAEKWDPSTSKRTVGPPKTAKSNRTIVLPPDALPYLAPVIEGRKRGDRLFVPPNGGPLRHMTFYRDIWRRKSTAGLDDPKPRIHDLRHSHVAWLIANGVPLPVIQQRLGHEKIETTVNVYGHLMPDLIAAATAAANRVFAAAPIRALSAPSEPNDATDELLRDAKLDT